MTSPTELRAIAHVAFLWALALLFVFAAIASPGC
jgi:hypothetical protein